MASPGPPSRTFGAMALRAEGIINVTLEWLDDGGKGMKLYRKKVENGEDAKKAAQDVFVTQLKLRTAELAACVPALPEDCADAVGKAAGEIEAKDIVDISRFIDNVKPTQWLGRFALGLPEALEQAHLGSMRVKLAALAVSLGDLIRRTKVISDLNK